MTPKAMRAHGRDVTTRKRQRFINVVALLIGVFFIAVYGSTLTANLSATTAESEFRSIDDLKSCKIAADRVCFPDRDAAKTFWDESIAVSLRSASCKSLSSKVVATIADGFNILTSKSSCDFFFASGGTTQWHVTGEFCKRLSIVGSSFYDIDLSFVLPQQSNLTSLMSNETLRLRETGQLQSAADYTRVNLPQCITSPTAVKMTWERLKVFFFMCWAVLTALIVAMIACPGKCRAGERDECKDLAFEQDTQMHPSRGFAIPQMVGPPMVAAQGSGWRRGSIESGLLPPPIAPTGNFAGLAYC
jgi:hypothetical protein